MLYTRCPSVGRKDRVSSVDNTPPTRADFTTCGLTVEDKEKFLAEHNKFRGMVDPPAADMEYLFWDDNLANLAQMWANKCIWDHGFLTFGDQYLYPVDFKGQIGQNLARQTDRLENPEDRVERWYLEYKQYTYNKYPNTCRRAPCGHYTQLAWATHKYVGCAINVCPTFNDDFWRNNRFQEGTMVNCDYGPSTGNVQGQYPYQRGTPCSKCASGKGFCYHNLCRDCDNFDTDCGGTGFPLSMCTTHLDLMERKCPKLCNLCKCPLKCQNGGTVVTQNCVCSCLSGWKGMDCSVKDCPPGYYGVNCENRYVDRKGTETCEWRVKNGHSCEHQYMKTDCALTCSKITAAAATTPAPVTTLPTPPLTTTECILDLNVACEKWAAFGECEKNAEWMIPNCCVSCKYHQAPRDCKDTDPSCPLWAYAGECEDNRVWMMGNCRKSCNLCGDCKDTDAKCPSWALLDQCSSGDRITFMNTNCRRSCGLCRVYDRNKDCPAWAAMDECKKSNWTWMVDHCPRSCDVPFSESSFCGGKTNGNYQAPTTCQAYIACSNDVTHHVACPAGKKFDTVKRICEPTNQATCTVDCPSKKSSKMIATL
ncbi:Cysteine-rich secretory protein LCCL [Desmophyllum pertusum]|uniref:Cysteine-rich secretory protein LCCL n=1 Tax=Desmophyllum pertusum TaxID=174260 RepID=A0A9W9Z4Q0_9CNID|nr:Cysteine-rich secretory protein LCCL [Desmophyllum pertusum]